MDDRQSDFITILGLVCGRAQTAGHQMELVTMAGEVVAGLPEAPETNGEHELDDTGFRAEVTIDDTLVYMDDVRSFTVLLGD